MCTRACVVPTWTRLDLFSNQSVCFPSFHSLHFVLFARCTGLLCAFVVFLARRVWHPTTAAAIKPPLASLGGLEDGDRGISVLAGVACGRRVHVLSALDERRPRVAHEGRWTPRLVV